MNYLKQYYDEIELGKIKVGNELKAVLDSLISDLDNPKYFFDEKPGELRINFIERIMGESISSNSILL